MFPPILFEPFTPPLLHGLLFYLLRSNFALLGVGLSCGVFFVLVLLLLVVLRPLVAAHLLAPLGARLAPVQQQERGAEEHGPDARLWGRRWGI